MKRMYVQIHNRTDDGGFATSGDWHSLGDSAAVMPGYRSSWKSSDHQAPHPMKQTSGRGSMTSVHGVPAIHYIDTQTHARVHPLSVSTLLAPQADNTEVSA